jgi:DNA-binding HxlR family transcriptional regulator
MRCRKCGPVPEEVRRAADLLERRWTVTILWAAHEGALRFNEFRYACGPIPPRTLAERLTDLEQAGVLERVVIDARPPRAEYRLTERGRALKALVDALARWAQPRGAKRTAETPVASR